MSRFVPHWPEYAIEAATLGLFLVSAAAFATLLQHPDSPVATWHAHPFVLRLLMGLAMGTTAAALIYSPLGQRSGAHMNPAVTLAFLRLGRMAPVDAAGYVAAQFVGGVLGIVTATALLGGRPADPSVNYVATEPGPWGPVAAFGAESAIAFLMMTTILAVSNTPRLARFTGAVAGLLVAALIAVEAPVSGMSMNPARSLGSNLLAGAVDSLWIYFTAPPFGMLAAAEVRRRRAHAAPVRCARLHHAGTVRCIFRCGYASAPAEPI
jgi:aquaporin Z